MPEASDRIQSTKLSMPHTSRKLIHRPRVAELLSGALDARLVLVSAPPGFGKTTALVDWLTASGIRSSWLGLDESDNDPVRFQRNLRASVANLANGDPGAVELAPPPNDPVVAAGELAALLAELPEPAVLVLDDYHLIGAPELQQVVGRLLERLPPHVHLVIATRADPRMPLARLRARGELLEVRADALRFTVDEASAFFSERMGLTLSESDLETLVARTEGWPAVLQLAGLSLSRRRDVAGGVRDFAATHRFVLDYVVEEVLAGLPPDTQDFLLQTSVLERLGGPLCDAVTGQTDSQARLEELDRANLLIVPLDDERRWYRYHALFAEVLRARLLASQPDEIARLHVRASAWHEAQGNDDEAIRHALRSGDIERTGRLVAEASMARLHAGELRTLRRWLDALPADVVRADAQLSASYAWILTLAGETEGVLDRLADADRALAAGHDGGPTLRPMIPAELALLRLRLASLEGDTATAIVQARHATALLPAGLPAATEATLRGDASVFLAVALARAGDTDGAVSAYRESLPALRAGGNMFAVGRAIADLAAIEIARGEPEAALRLCEAELDASAAKPAATASPALWAAMARARAELGQAELADAAAHRALELAGRAGDTPSAHSAEATLARIRHVAAIGTGDARRHPHPGPEDVETLTAREVEVLGVVARGRSNSQIAAELFVTVGTVKAHLHTISGKLGAANRVEAVVRGRELGLLD